MTTSTLLIQQIASSTGELIQAGFPLFWWISGFFLAFFAIMIISRSFWRAVGLVKGRNR